MRALVTGASGFLGRSLVSWLRTQGHDTWVIVHDEDLDCPGVRRIRGSVSDIATCERAMVESRADAVFHLAAQALVPHARLDPYGTLESNVRGTYSMLEAFRRHRGPEALAIVASSDKAYGNTGIRGVYCEISPMRGRGPYDVSKSCTDLIAQSYSYEYGLPIGIVRAGNIYGPGDTDLTRIVPSVASALVSGRAPVLTSDGTPVRDYLYISDAVEAYASMLRHVPGSSGPQAFNFSGGEPVSASRLAELAIGIAGIDGMRAKVLGTRTGEIQRQVLDSTLARRLLSWSPSVSLETGLRRTIDWWRSRG